MTRGTGGIACIALVTALAACADSSAPTAPAVSVARQESEGIGLFHRYVAVGTSVSMGWASDGVLAASQSQAWPAQLARLAGREITQPQIGGEGCRSPLVAPLASGLRTSGESAGAAAASFACAALRPEVTLPAQNVAISSATTFEALNVTPETKVDPFYSKLYPRVLPPGHTQVSAMEAQNPKFVSVELGANEVLNARSGIAIPGATIVPFAQWAPVYSQLLDRVERLTKRGVLVGLIDDVGSFPSFRRGAELWADRAAFLAVFHVAVNVECESSPNLLFVPVRIPVAVATGLARKQNGQLPFDLRCADGGTGVQDFVLTPAEVSVVNAIMAQMSGHIRQEAQSRGFAYFALEELYGLPDLKPPFSVVQLMTSQSPYGQLVSLDGIHPSAAGQQVLAEAAARAINAKYQFGIEWKPLF